MEKLQLLGIKQFLISFWYFTAVCITITLQTEDVPANSVSSPLPRYSYRLQAPIATSSSLINRFATTSRKPLHSYPFRQSYDIQHSPHLVKYISRHRNHTPEHNVYPSNYQNHPDSWPHPIQVFYASQFYPYPPQKLPHTSYPSPHNMENYSSLKPGTSVHHHMENYPSLKPDTTVNHHMENYPSLKPDTSVHHHMENYPSLKPDASVHHHMENYPSLKPDASVHHHMENYPSLKPGTSVHHHMENYPDSSSPTLHEFPQYSLFNPSFYQNSNFDSVHSTTRPTLVYKPHLTDVDSDVSISTLSDHHIDKPLNSKPILSKPTISGTIPPHDSSHSYTYEETNPGKPQSNLLPYFYSKPHRNPHESDSEVVLTHSSTHPHKKPPMSTLSTENLLQYLQSPLYRTYSPPLDRLFLLPASSGGAINNGPTFSGEQIELPQDATRAYEMTGDSSGDITSRVDADPHNLHYRPVVWETMYRPIKWEPKWTPKWHHKWDLKNHKLLHLWSSKWPGYWLPKKKEDSHHLNPHLSLEPNVEHAPWYQPNRRPEHNRIQYVENFFAHEPEPPHSSSSYPVAALYQHVDPWNNHHRQLVDYLKSSKHDRGMPFEQSNLNVYPDYRSVGATFHDPTLDPWSSYPRPQMDRQRTSFNPQFVGRMNTPELLNYQTIKSPLMKLTIEESSRASNPSKRYVVSPSSSFEPKPTSQYFDTENDFPFGFNYNYGTGDSKTPESWDFVDEDKKGKGIFDRQYDYFTDVEGESPSITQDIEKRMESTLVES